MSTRSSFGTARNSGRSDWNEHQALPAKSQQHAAPPARRSPPRTSVVRRRGLLAWTNRPEPVAAIGSVITYQVYWGNGLRKAGATQDRRSRNPSGYELRPADVGGVSMARLLGWKPTGSHMPR